MKRWEEVTDQRFFDHAPRSPTALTAAENYGLLAADCTSGATGAALELRAYFAGGLPTIDLKCLAKCAWSK